MAIPKEDVIITTLKDSRQEHYPFQPESGWWKDLHPDLQEGMGMSNIVDSVLFAWNLTHTCVEFGFELYSFENEIYLSC